MIQSETIHLRCRWPLNNSLRKSCTLSLKRNATFLRGFLLGTRVRVMWPRVVRNLHILASCYQQLRKCCDSFETQCRFWIKGCHVSGNVSGRWIESGWTQDLFHKSNGFFNHCCMSSSTAYWHKWPQSLSAITNVWRKEPDQFCLFMIIAVFQPSRHFAWKNETSWILYCCRDSIM